jgi:hypothetical protein
MAGFAGTLHVLLVGIDAYPIKPLGGCVADIDAVEALLLEAPGVGVGPERIRIRRLAAPAAGAPSTSRLAGETIEPTYEHLVAALGELAGPAVAPGDRVLLYYSGHGTQMQWLTRAWHESLVTVDMRQLFDVELNAWLHAIARPGPEGAAAVDLTVVLDCCNASGATRDAVARLGDDPRTAVRSLPAAPDLAEPPDISRIPAAADGLDRGAGPARPVDAPYVVVAACQSTELAGEKELDGVRHGNLTRALLGHLARRDAAARAGLRWGTVWPDLLVALAELAAAAPATPPQSPWLTGRPERFLFGGTWQPRDLGFAVTKLSDDRVRVHAGHVMGITAGAELAVYGPDEPLLFGPVGSPADLAARWGVVRITEAQAADSDGVVVEAAPATPLPEGARARLVAPGAAGPLRVWLENGDDETKAELAASLLLATVPGAVDDPEVFVDGDAARGWTIRTDLEPELAVVPPGRADALRVGLDQFARANATLRLARTLRSPDGPGRLALRLLHLPQAGPIEDEAIAALAEAPRSAGGDYDLPQGFPFCIELANLQREDLNVTVLNCTAGGKVEYLDAVLVRGRRREQLWLRQERGRPFIASPSRGRPAATDRLIAVGTTGLAVELDGLEVKENVQDVIDEWLGAKAADDTPRSAPPDPVEIWTAVTQLIRIHQPGHAAPA